MRQSAIVPNSINRLGLNSARDIGGLKRVYSKRTNDPLHPHVDRHSAARAGATAPGPGKVVRSSPGKALDRIRVATGPGSNRFTRTCVVASSWAQVNTRCSIPAFVAPIAPQ